MATPVFLNGRFLEQRVTGVQRYAREIAAAMAGLAARGEFPAATVLIPRPRPRPLAEMPYCHGLEHRIVGRLQGHLWEQASLPRAARGGVLLSLGNTGPVLAGARQVVVIHDAGVFDVPGSYGWRFRTWYRAVQRGLVRGHARIVTVSEFSRERIAAQLGLDPSTIAVTGEGGEHVRRVEPDPATLTRHGLRRCSFALVVGVGAEHKNLEALGRLSAELESWGMVLVLTGGAGAAAILQPNGCRRPLGRQLGRVSDAELRALYDSAACLVFPSRYEGFGLPPIEAMACGCPVIAAAGGAVEEICGSAALYFDPADPDAIVKLCRCVVDQPTLSCELSLQGRQRAARFTWERAARVLGDVIAEVAAGDGAPHPGTRLRDRAASHS